MGVFIDLDGTLTDPAEGILGAVRNALIAVGVTPPDDLDWVIGPSLLDSFTQLGAPDPKAALALYRAEYGAGGLFRARVYDGVLPALARLAGLSPLYLATAKPHIFARQITSHFGLDAFFAHQFGPELDGTHGDKADLLAHACKLLSLDPSRAIMVGDRGVDMSAARANGMAFIGVSWGYGRAGELDGADTVCHAPGDLPQAITALRAQR